MTYAEVTSNWRAATVRRWTKYEKIHEAGAYIIDGAWVITTLAMFAILPLFLALLAAEPFVGFGTKYEVPLFGGPISFLGLCTTPFLYSFLVAVGVTVGLPVLGFLVQMAILSYELLLGTLRLPFRTYLYVMRHA